MRETDDRRERADAPAVHGLSGNPPDGAEEVGGDVDPQGVRAVQDTWRIIASHSDSAHPVMLYITPYEHLATQEWFATEQIGSTLGPGDSDLHDHRLQVRAEGEWRDVARAS